DSIWICRRLPFAMPGVKPDMVVIAASRKKCRLIAIHRRQFKTQQVPVECECSVQIRHFEVDMSYMCLWGNFIIVHSTCVFIFYINKVKIKKIWNMYIVILFYVYEVLATVG